MICLDPVAYMHTTSYEKADVPRQGSLATDHLGMIRFLPENGFEQALEDLKGMEKIWVLFWMHEVKHWKVKVQPPRDVCKKGVFATRSPHRPNPIGLSCVTLLEVRGLDVFIKDHDLLDQTPILDIKPYLPYADSFPQAKMGWMEGTSSIPSNSIHWNELSLKQLAFLKKEGIDLKGKVESRLKHFSSPSSSNRIKFLGENIYLEFYKEWRILFEKKDVSIEVLAILSGYEVPAIEKYPLHQAFLAKFPEIFASKADSLYTVFKQSKGEDL